MSGGVPHPPPHSDEGDEWKFVGVDMADLPPKITTCLGNRYKAQRRCFKFHGSFPPPSALTDELQTYTYYPKAKLPYWAPNKDGWGYGLMINSKKIKTENPKKGLLDAVLVNPLDGEQTSLTHAISISNLLPADMSVLQQMVTLANRPMFWEEFKPPSPNLDGLYADYPQFIEKASSLPDPKADFYVRLNIATRTAFGCTDNIYMDINTMERLMADPIAYFKAQMDVPLRDEKGSPFSVKIGTLSNSAQYRTDKTVWKNIFTNSTGSGSYKPPRSLNPDITIHLFHLNNNLIQSVEFNEIVQRVGEAGVSPSAGTKLRTKYNINNIKPDANYYEIGTSPFHEYSTYIAKSDLITYLTERPPRALPTPKLIEEITNTMKKALDKSSLRAKELRSQMEAKFQSSTKTTTTKVNYFTLSEAVNNPRTGEPNQAQVWGESATVLAKSLGWQKDTVLASPPWAPKPKFKCAEWLHRSAYSFGGLKTGHAGSSQIPPNLIFGTSETNSVMTRYETIWQEYIRKMGAATSSTNSSVLRGLFVTTNEDTVDLRIKKLNGNDIVEELVQATKKDGLEQAWLCYRLDCRFTFPALTNVIGFAEQSVYMSFYPFERMFFTAFEAAIDRSLLNYIFARASGDKSALDNVIEVPEQTTEPEPEDEDEDD